MQKNNWYKSFKTAICNICYIINYTYKICRMRVFSIFIIAFVNGINAANVALFYKYAIGTFEEANPYFYLAVIILAYLLLHLGNSVINNYYSYVKFPKWDMKIRTMLSKDLYKKYAFLDLSTTNNTEFYNKYTRAIKEADQRSVQVLNSFQYFFSNFFSAIGMLSVIVMMDPVLILFSVIPVITSSVINMKISKERYQYEMLMTKDVRKNDYIKRIFTVPEYREEIRTNVYLPFLVDKYSISIDSINQTIKTKMPSIIHKSVFGANLFSFINYSVPALYLSWRVLNQDISIGEFSSLLICTTNLSTSIFYAVILLPQIVEHSMFISNLREVMEYQSEMSVSKKVRSVEKEKNHSIKIEHVSFRYYPNEKEVLQNISLHIKKGEKIALVGKNGAGKSTLAKLILRLYDPQEGSLYFDEMAYKALEIKSLRDEIAIIYQDHPLFAFSIGENVLCRELQNKKDEKRVWNALKASGLSSKINVLSEKLDTPLSNEFEEKGINLSGGESQKLSMAKAICKDIGVIIMDEPSSSLDPLSEYEMYSRMSDMCGDKTVILISHRLYSTKMVDKIYFLEDGAIVESGSHEELMRQNGKYADLYHIQAEQYQ